MYLFDVPVLELSVDKLCNDANLNCTHGCRLKPGVDDDVECFCKDGFDAYKNACTGNILFSWIK